MIVYILIILYLVFFWNKSLSIEDTDVKAVFEKRIMIIYVVILSVLAALKYIVPGSDMSGYVGDYNRIAYMSFAEVLSGNSNNHSYYFISKLFSFTHLSYHYWFAVIEAVYFGGVVAFINRFSEDKLYSLLLSFTISIFSFTLFGSKQTLAMGFAIFAVLFLTDKKYLLSILLFLIAYSCHHASLILIIPFVAYLFRERYYYWHFILTGSFLIVFSGTFLLKNVLLFIDSEHYIETYMYNRSSYSNTVIIYYLIIFLFGFFNRKRYAGRSLVDSRFIISMSLLCVVVQSMARINADFFRLAYYFIPFLIIMPANTLRSSERGRTYQLILAAITIFFMLYTSRNEGYTFMWQ